MKKFSLIVILLFIFGCNEKHIPREMTALEVMGQINNDFSALIDIREKNTFKSMAKPARWIPLSILIKNKKNLTKVIDASIRNKTLIVYSNNTNDSKQACAILIDIDIKCNYIKNYKEWEKNNLPTRLSGSNQ